MARALARAILFNSTSEQVGVAMEIPGVPLPEPAWISERPQIGPALSSS